MTGVLGLRNSLWAIILPYSFNSFWVIVMRTFFQTQVPLSLIESARIDGAGEWRTFLQIVLPISLPGLATIALFTTLGVWNDWFNCVLFIDKPELSNLNTLIYRALTSARMLREIAATMGSADAAARLVSAQRPSDGLGGHYHGSHRFSLSLFPEIFHKGADDVAQSRLIRLQIYHIL